MKNPAHVECLHNPPADTGNKAWYCRECGQFQPASGRGHAPSGQMPGPIYIVSRSGDALSVWGPYDSTGQARHAAGRTYQVCAGTGLRNGETISRGEFQARVQSGAIMLAD